mmetsp:Transcript_19358/g.48394  ORF Transcript_19358/g.48394 Transcript_19358/m.48394 type:complete len:220 (-) Transcript_19358:1007-1666(-)
MSSSKSLGNEHRGPLPSRSTVAGMSTLEHGSMPMSSARLVVVGCPATSRNLVLIRVAVLEKRATSCTGGNSFSTVSVNGDPLMGSSLMVMVMSYTPNSSICSATRYRPGTALLSTSVKRLWSRTTGRWLLSGMPYSLREVRGTISTTTMSAPAALMRPCWSYACTSKKDATLAVTFSTAAPSASVSAANTATCRITPWPVTASPAEGSTLTPLMLSSTV